MEIFSISPSWLKFTALLILLLVSCIFLYTSLKSNGSSKHVPKLPPTPPKLPIIGNLHQLLGKLRHEALWQLSKDYGPIMQIYLGSKPFLVVSSSAVAKEILKTHDHVFCSRPLFQATQRLTYNYLDIAFSPHSGHWREMRKLLVSEFIGPKRANLFNHALVTEMETVVGYLSLHPSKDPVNLNGLFLEIVKGLVCKVAFGKNYREVSLNGPAWEMMLFETLELLNGSVGDYFPWLGRLIDRFSGWNGKLDKGFKDIDVYMDMVIDELYHHNIEEISDDDKGFLHTLLEISSKENAYGYRLSNGDIKALIMDVLTGGIDTTVVTMVWAMSEIIKNPRVMQKLQSEIRNCTGSILKVEQMNTSKMSYLKLVVKETLRLHTPAPLLIPHHSLNHCQIGGYDVPTDTTVFVNAWGIGRDPATWGQNAAVFYPERFETLDVDYGVPSFEMLPFGFGRRSCPAINTAPATVEFVIANLLYWFDWQIPSATNNTDLDMQDAGTLVLRKRFPLLLNYTNKA